MMSLPKTFLLLLLHFTEYCKCNEFKNTWLSCYICMEVEHMVIQEPCVKGKPMIQTCTFTKTLLNWKHLQDKLDHQVRFQCLLLYYKKFMNSSLLSKRGCVAVYGDYNACENMDKIIQYEEEISCEVCNVSYCNKHVNPGPDDSDEASIFIIDYIYYNKKENKLPHVIKFKTETHIRKDLIKC